MKNSANGLYYCCNPPYHLFHHTLRHAPHHLIHPHCGINRSLQCCNLSKLFMRLFWTIIIASADVLPAAVAVKHSGLAPHQTVQCGTQMDFGDLE